MQKIFFLGLLLLLFSGSIQAQDVSKFEIFGGYSYDKRGRNEDLNGFDTSVTANLSKNFGVVADFGGLYRRGNGVTAAFIVISDPNNPKTFTFVSPSDIYTFMAGPKYTNRDYKFFSFYLQGLAGIYRVSEASATFTIPPSTLMRRDFSNVGLATALGGGIDLNVNRYLAIRALQADYLFLHNVRNLAGAREENGARLSFGLVLKLGKR